ncbi:Retrovirus-related Pol polyprotein from transposon TNT 1-94 [Vitis vinifera]|uniref:Retrovirus-related Pol polyprotein from transposon TNT 1-94 n=1 Tax=Vitis vinifera TaxID=29760 RepID=A0A438CLE3_VITVI|nr:Retrovirus-related Pol polyprotein from transposon TNT 1-94 [Vitis vinifera]
MSLMIMKGSITPAIRGAIPDSNNAMTYIKSVEEQFLGTSKSLASTLMIKMITMKYDGHSGVREHIMKMSDMASQLKGMDMAISEGFLVHFIMTSLPSQFGPFKINYNTQKDKWKMSELIAMCVQEEERLKVEKPDMAHLTIGPNKKSFKKGKGKKNNQGNDVSHNGQKDENKIQCHFCHKKGHKRRDCFGFKAWLEKKGKTQCLVSYESYLVIIPPNSWWIDTGASIHITNSLQGYLTSKRLSKGERTITLGNGTEVEIEAIGTLRLILDTGFIMDLVDTVYVPVFTRNLISVPRLDSYGYELKFGNKGVSLFYNSCLVGSGTLRESMVIIANYTMPGTLEQNGVAERRNRTLIDMVRSMMSNSTLPEFLWGETLKTTVHILNRVPSKVSCNENENVPTIEVSLRRSQREKRPAISNDCEVYLNECDYDVGLESDPTSYDQAINSENSTLWLYAMEEELKSMKDNEVWDLVELPKGIKTIGCKWIFKTKHDSKGNVERYKVRLVAKGYTQKEGIDYKETFSPISKKDSLRIVMALVAHFDLELHQMDVKTAFLNGDLHEEVYMDPPEGFQDKGKAHMVCKLKKSIYGLKQASRQWYLKFHEILITFGFKENLVDQCIYLKISGSKICIIVLYVDDMLLASNNMGMILETKQFLSKNFDMKDLGEASYVIGIEIHRDRSRGLLGLSQKNYIEKVLKRFNMQNCSSSVAPVVKGDIFCELQCPKNDLEKKQMDKIPYASAARSSFMDYVARMGLVASLSILD